MKFSCILIIHVFYIFLLLQSSESKCLKLLTPAKNIKNINNDLKSFLEDIRNRMCHPIDKLKLPSLDPFETENLQYNLTAEFGKFDFFAKNIKGNGLSDFVVKDLRLQFLPPKFFINIYIPKQKFDIKYKLNGTLNGLLDIDGEGDIFFAVEKVGINFEAKINLLSGLSITILKLEPYIEKFDLRIDNLFPDKELNDFINKMVKDLAPEMVNEIWVANKSKLIVEIEKVATNILKDYTILEIQKIIANLKNFFDKNDPEPNCKSNIKKNQGYLRNKIWY